MPLLFAAVFVLGRSELGDETGPGPAEEEATDDREPTEQALEGTRPATPATGASATPEEAATQAPETPTSVPAQPPAIATPEPTPLAEQAPEPPPGPAAAPEAMPAPDQGGKSPEPLPSTESAVVPPRDVEVPPDRTSCGAITGTSYRSAMERAWYLTNCGRRTQASPAVARAISTPARSVVAPPAPVPAQARDLYGVSRTLCASGAVRYPAFREDGIIYGACTAMASSPLPNLICSPGYVLIPSRLHADAIYCYPSPRAR